MSGTSVLSALQVSLSPNVEPPSTVRSAFGLDLFGSAYRQVVVPRAKGRKPPMFVVTVGVGDERDCGVCIRIVGRFGV